MRIGQGRADRVSIEIGGGRANLKIVMFVMITGTSGLLFASTATLPSC